MILCNNFLIILKVCNHLKSAFSSTLSSITLKYWYDDDVSQCAAMIVSTIQVSLTECSKREATWVTLQDFFHHQIFPPSEWRNAVDACFLVLFLLLKQVNKYVKLQIEFCASLNIITLLK